MSTRSTIKEAARKKKKKKYLDVFLEHQQTFIPLSYPVDGMARKEAKAFEKRIAALLVEKWKQAYREMCGYVRSMIAISIVCSNLLLLYGLCQGQSFWAQFEDRAALESMHCGNW